MLKHSVSQVFDELSRLRNVIGSTDGQEQRFDYDLNNNLSDSQLGGDNTASTVDAGIDNAVGGNTVSAHISTY